MSQPDLRTRSSKNALSPAQQQHLAHQYHEDDSAHVGGGSDPSVFIKQSLVPPFSKTSAIVDMAFERKSVALTGESGTSSWVTGAFHLVRISRIPVTRVRDLHTMWHSFAWTLAPGHCHHWSGSSVIALGICFARMAARPATIVFVRWCSRLDGHDAGRHL